MSAGLYLDANAPFAIAEQLRRRGCQVVTAQEDGNSRTPDEKLLERAQQLDRLLFTQDDDFLEIAADWQASGRPFRAIVYAHQQGPSLGQIIQDLETLLTVAEDAELWNYVYHLPLR